MTNAKKTIMGYKERLREEAINLEKKADELFNFVAEMTRDFDSEANKRYGEDDYDLMMDLEESVIDQETFNALMAVRSLCDVYDAMEAAALTIGTMFLE